MPVSNEDELREQIENMEAGYESIKYNHKQKIKELIAEFISDLSSREWLESEDLERLIKKWEKRKK